MKKQISPKIVSLVFGVLVICFAIAFYAIGWTEPGSAPPGGNVPAPLNTGPTGQSKEGGLILNTGGAASGLIVDKGKVGIGTTSPAQRLHVAAGNLRVDGAIVAPEGTLRDDGGGWIRTYGATGWYSQTYGGGWYMIDTTWIRAYGNKNVYTTGEMRAGTVRANSSLCIGNDCRTEWPEGGAGDGNDYVNSMSFSTATGVLTLGRTGSLSDLTQDLDGRYLTTESDPQVGTLTNGKWCTTNGSQVNCTSDAPGGVSSCADCDSRFVNVTGDTMTGNLGVKIAPDAPLTVYGALRLRGYQAGDYWYTNLHSGHSWAHPFSLTVAGGHSTALELIGAYLNAGVRETTLMYGNVGIGTTNPTEKLEVFNSGRSIVSIKGDPNGNWVGTSIKNTSNNEKWFIGSNANKLLFRRNGSSNDMVIDTAGNIGIGTTGPGAKLDIRPSSAQYGLQVKSTNYNSYFESTNTGFGGTASVFHIKVASAVTGPYALRVQTGGDTNALGVMCSGRVGIGTPNPTQKLDVAGYVKGRSGLCIGNDCRSSWLSVLLIDGKKPIQTAYVGGTGVAIKLVSNNDFSEFSTLNWWCETGNWDFYHGDIQESGIQHIAFFYTCTQGGKWYATFDFASHNNHELFWGDVICFRKEIVGTTGREMSCP